MISTHACTVPFSLSLAMSLLALLTLSASIKTFITLHTGMGRLQYQQLLFLGLAG